MSSELAALDAKGFVRPARAVRGGDQFRSRNRGRIQAGRDARSKKVPALAGQDTG